MNWKNQMKRSISTSKKPKLTESENDDLKSPKSIKDERDEYMKKELTNQVQSVEEQEISKKKEEKDPEDYLIMFMRFYIKGKVQETYKVINETGKEYNFQNMYIQIKEINKNENNVTVRTYMKIEKKQWNFATQENEIVEDVDYNTVRIKVVRLHDILIIDMDTRWRLFESSTEVNAILFLMKYDEYIVLAENDLVDKKALKVEDGSDSRTCLIYLSKEFNTTDKNKRMIKRVNLNSSPGIYMQFCMEINVYNNITRQGGHRNVCKMIGTQIMDEGNTENDNKYGSTFPCLVLEEGLALRNLLCALYKKDPKNYYSKMVKYSRHMLEGVKYLHSIGFVHFDIKPDNFIYKQDDEGGVVKIMDFGLALTIEEAKDDQQSRGTRGFMAPEVYEKRELSDPKKADVWSLGCTILTMLGNDMEHQKICDLIEGVFTGKNRGSSIDTEIEKALVDYKAKWDKQYDKDRLRSEVWTEILLSMLKINVKWRIDLENIIIPDGI